FDSTLNDTTADGSQLLDIVGNAVFNGIVGGAVNGKLKSLDVSGTTFINTTAITSTTTQEYHGAATLGKDATLTGSLVTFDSTLNDTTADGSQLLDIVGNAVFNGMVGGAVNGKLKSLDVSGTTFINTTAITSTTTQEYHGAATLGKDATLTGSLVTFDST